MPWNYLWEPKEEEIKVGVVGSSSLYINPSLEPKKSPPQVTKQPQAQQGASCYVNMAMGGGDVVLRHRRVRRKKVGAEEKEVGSVEAQKREEKEGGC